MLPRRWHFGCRHGARRIIRSSCSTYQSVHEDALRRQVEGPVQRIKRTSFLSPERPEHARACAQAPSRIAARHPPRQRAIRPQRSTSSCSSLLPACPTGSMHAHAHIHTLRTPTGLRFRGCPFPSSAAPPARTASHIRGTHMFMHMQSAQHKPKARVHTCMQISLFRVALRKA